MVKDTTNFIKSCLNCQINKEKMNGKPVGLLHPVLTDKQLNRLTFDYLGPLSPSNKSLVKV